MKKNNDMLENKRIYHFEDRFFRQRNIHEINAGLKEMGFDDELVLILNSAFVEILGEKRADKVGITKKGVFVIAEFEYSEPSEKAIIKINHYALSLREKIPIIKKKLKELNFNIEVTDCIRKIMIIAKPDKIEKEITLNLNCHDENFKIEPYYPFSINAREKLKTINDKLSNNSDLELGDYFFIENSMHTNHDGMKAHEVLIEVIDAYIRTKPNLENRREYTLIFNEQCNRYINKNYQPTVRRKINMLFMKPEYLIKEIENQAKYEERNKTLEACIDEGASEEFINNVLNRLENQSK